jgi:hypothetical protein
MVPAYFAIGPGVVVVAVVTVAVVVGLAWSGPKVNGRLYGTPEAPDARLHVQSAVERRAGTLEVDETRLTWRPWKRYEGRVQPIEVSLDELDEAIVYARSGIPASCRLELRTSSGAVWNVTVFASADVVKQALGTP